MSTEADFQNEPLDRMVAVRSVQADAVHLWLCTERPGRVKVRWWPDGDEARASEQQVEVGVDPAQDNTCLIRLPGEDGALAPLQRYRFRVTRPDDGRLVGEGRFETAPDDPADTPGRFAVGLMSCHQPFNADGTIREGDAEMLRATQRILEQHNAKFVLAMGDQMYADWPPALSLLDEEYFATVAPPGRARLQDCTVAEVRRLYQRRYRHFWSLPGWKALCANFPCYPILDDHDIVDNWGSDPAHQEPEWRSVGEGARWAYHDYQGIRPLPVGGELPPSFHYTITYGHTAVFVMDLRSERRAGEGGRLFSKDQENDLRAFLHRHRHHKVLLFVLSVPVVHLPRVLAKTAARMTSDGEDFSDRWSSLAHVEDRDRFLEIICEHQGAHPEQRVVFLSGDIHIGCVHEVRWEERPGEFYQIVSSGITHTASLPIRLGSRLLIRLNQEISTQDGRLQGAVRLLQGTPGHTQNPYGDLNLGIVEIETPSPEAGAKLRFYLYGHNDGEPVCVYRSPLV